ncbi:PulJ/GspJ family protein [Halobacteriovorax marinus]|uniref:PulJ/GspJ family protein n=1 Tax=Halobacteriovorax marinus TaxID=97084 RepID=UPI003A913BFA
MKKVLLNSSGFSLAEIVVAAGMLGVVSLGVMQLMSNMSKGQKKLEQDSNVTSVALRAEQVLRRENNCSATLRGRNLTSGAWQSIDDIMRARDTWERSNAGDTAAQKVAALSRDNVYGGSKDRVRLSEISFRGFYDTSSTSYASGTYSNTPESTYEFIGDTGATDGGADTDRRRGFTVVRLEFQRQVTNRGATDDEIQEQFAKKSFGLEKSYKYIQFEVITNGAGVIQSCYADNQNFVESSCDTLDGMMENGDCKNLTIRNRIGLGAPAVTVEGNMQVNPDISDGDAGSIGIGLVPNAASNSNLDVAGSAGIGVASTGTAGDLSVSNSIGVGMLPVSGNPGNISAGRSVGIGVAANDAAGDLLVARSQAIGDAMSTHPVDGMLKVKTGVTIGPNGMAATPGSGSLAVNHSVAIGPGNNVSGSDGNLDVNKSVSIGSGFDPNNADGDLRVKNSIRAGGNNSAGLSQGAIESINGTMRVTIDSGRISTSERYNSIAAASSLAATNFVTKEWVNWAIASTLKTSEAASTIANYINTVGSQGDTYAALRRAICDSIVVNGAGMNQSCQLNNVARISTTYNSSTNVITITQQNPSYSQTYTLKDCSQSGRCSNVYANSWVKSTGISAFGRLSSAYDYHGSGSVVGRRICIYGSCRTTFSNQKCPNGQIMVGLTSSGYRICTAHHPWPQ